MLGGGVLYSVRGNAVIRVGHAAHDHADGLCSAGAKRRCGTVSHIAHLVGNRLDLLTRGDRDIALVLERAGNGIDGETCALGDILQGAAVRLIAFLHRLPSFICK